MNYSDTNELCGLLREQKALIKKFEHEMQMIAIKMLGVMDSDDEVHQVLVGEALLALKKRSISPYIALVKVNHV